MRLLFATGNQAKLAQLRFVAESLSSPVEVASARELYGDLARYDEVGETVMEVALNGALAVAARLEEPVMTEDTGLYVDALDGRPGVQAKDMLKSEGRQGLVERLSGLAFPERLAEVVSAVCYATPQGEGRVFVNRLRGSIAEEERWGDYPTWVAPREPGSSGGGYNAVFVPLGRARTLAETAPEEALYWSYRERNFRAVLELVAELAAASQGWQSAQ